MVQRRPSLWLFKKLILNLRSRQLQLRSQQLGSDFEPFSDPRIKLVCPSLRILVSLSHRICLYWLVIGKRFVSFRRFATMVEVNRICILHVLADYHGEQDHLVQEVGQGEGSSEY